MRGRIRLFNHSDREVHAALKIGPVILAKKSNILPKSTHLFDELTFVWVTVEINDKEPFHFTSWMKAETPGTISLRLFFSNFFFSIFF